MKIRLISIGNKMPAWINTGFEEYAKRMPSHLAIDLIEIPLKTRGKNADITRLIEQEGNAMLKAIGEQDHVIALSINGTNWSTEKLADHLKDWQSNGQNITFIIGGPEGLASQCIARANTHWSLSKLTMPHPIVRVIIAEQLYRAYTILQSHPYHK